jgi:ABC-2 type transport system permease protein
VRAVVMRQFRERRRYVLDIVALLVTTYAVFVLLLLGARAAGGAGFAEGAGTGGLVVGFVVVTLVTLSYSTVAAGVQDEASRGTLEQIAMSPYVLPVVLLVTTIAASGFQVAEMTILLVAAVLTTGTPLSFDLLSALPIVVLLLAGVQGVGFVMGGLALVFKRVTSLTALLPLLFIVLVAAPYDSMRLLGLLPVTGGAALLREVLVEGTPLTGLAAADLGLLLASATMWLGGGLLVFSRLERVARSRALLGQY